MSTTSGETRRFHDLVRAGAPLNFSTRCRLIVDEVVKQHAGMDSPFGHDPGASSRAWLEDELGVAASTPGTIAHLVRPLVLPDTTACSPADLRAWVWRKVASPRDGSWSDGAESKLIWSLLMSPIPADDHELWWLASSNRLGIEQLRPLVELGMQQGSGQT